MSSPNLFSVSFARAAEAKLRYLGRLGATESTLGKNITENVPYKLCPYLQSGAW